MFFYFVLFEVTQKLSKFYLIISFIIFKYRIPYGWFKFLYPTVFFSWFFIFPKKISTIFGIL